MLLVRILDLVYLFKCLNSQFIRPFYFSHEFHQTQVQCLLQGYAIKQDQGQQYTVTFKNSFYCRAPGIWNTLPAHLRNTDCSVAHFKKGLFNYYLYLNKSVNDVDTPQTFKSVCIKCHTSQPFSIEQLARSYVLLIFLSISSPILFLHFHLFFCPF